MSDFHKAIVNVSSGLVAIPVILGLVICAVMVFIPMIMVAKVGILLLLLCLVILVFILS